MNSAPGCIPTRTRPNGGILGRITPVAMKTTPTIYRVSLFRIRFLTYSWVVFSPFYFLRIGAFGVVASMNLQIFQNLDGG